MRPLRFPLSIRLVLCLLAASGCNNSDDLGAPPPTPSDPLAVRQDRGLVAHDALREASGLVASRLNAGVLWTHNDSGDEPRLFALTTRGEHLGIYRLAGAANRDWEDLAVGLGPEPGRSYLYVGDIGDNQARHDRLFVYRVPEPRVDTLQAPLDTTLTDVDVLTLRYPDGPRDAETLMADPFTGDLYLVSKRSPSVTVYRAPFPHTTTEAITLEPVAVLQLDAVPNLGDDGQGAVAGDIDFTGLDVLLKSYPRIYRWRRPSPDVPFFYGAPTVMPYVPEPQGEALAWAADGRGYFTVSEEHDGIPARLYFYRLAEEVP